MLKYQKSRLHLLRISFLVFGSLYRVFAHFSPLIITSLQSIKCHPTPCPCLLFLLSSIAVLRAVVLSSYKHDSDLKSGSCVQLENTTRRRRKKTVILSDLVMLTVSGTERVVLSEGEGRDVV